MTHWAEKYVGKKYLVGEYDCAELAMEVARDEFGKDVRLLTERSKGIREQSSQIEACTADFAEPTNEPQDGDPVLMLCRNRLSHIGVLCVIDGQRWILHAVRSSGMVCLHRLHTLDKFNLRVEGYYKWKV